jgi:hypothetical protein
VKGLVRDAHMDRHDLLHRELAYQYDVLVPLRDGLSRLTVNPAHLETDPTSLQRGTNRWP